MAENSLLELDTDAVTYRTGVRSSLTDLNGIDLFTDAFRESLYTAGEQERQEQASLMGVVFLEEMEEQQDDSVLSEMFMQQDADRIVRDGQQTQERHFVQETIGGIALITVVFLAGIRMFIRQRKGKQNRNRENRENDNHSEFQTEA